MEIFRKIRRARSGRSEQPTTEKMVVLEDLRKILAEADRVVVKDSPVKDAETLFESTDKEDLDELWRSLTLETPAGWFHCMCIGAPALYVYERGCERVQLTNHHGLSVRCSLWASDVRISDTEKWLSWFDERGMTGPRQEVEAMHARQEKGKRDWDRWLGAMPKAVRSVWSDAVSQWRVDVAPLRAALKRDMPDEGECILALLEWFGSGAGPWSGFPSYETAAEELLLGFSTTGIVTAVESTRLSPAQTEGAARLFAGWSFGEQRPEGLKDLPDALKKLLWNHTKDTQDKDKVGRAKRALDSPRNCSHTLLASIRHPMVLWFRVISTLAKPKQRVTKTDFHPPVGVRLIVWVSLVLWMLLLFAPLDLGMYWLATLFALGLVYTVWRWPDTISIDELQICQSAWCRPRVSMLWEEIASVEVSKSGFGDALVLRGRSGDQIKISALQVGIDVLIEEIKRHTRIPCDIEIRRTL